MLEDDPEYDRLNDPIERAGLFEGDIDLRSGGFVRNAIRDLSKRWPGAKIPYTISSKFGSRERVVIAKAMKTYHEKTCLKFIPRTSQAGYIQLEKGTGCSSSIGRTGGRQTVSLGLGCVHSGQ